MISPIENGEIGSSVRAKLNQSIQAINEIPLTEIEEQGIAIATLQSSQGSQDTAIWTNATAITALNGQCGITSDVDVQYSEIRPLLNSKGQPLKDGDLWKKKRQEWGEFDAVQWCGTRSYAAATSTAVFTTNFFLPLSIPFKIIGSTPTANLKIISWDVYTSVAGATLNPDNFWTIEGLSRSVTGGDTLNTSFTFNSLTDNGKWQRLMTNRVLSQTLINSLFLRVRKTNLPSTGAFSHQICYAHVL